MLQNLSIAQAIVRSSATELNCATADIVDRLAGMRVGYAAASKNEKKLKEELAGFVADRLWSEATLSDKSTVAGVSFREDDSTNSLDFLTNIALALKPRLDTLIKDRPALFLLACGATAGSQASSGGAVLICGSEDLVKKAGKLMSAKFGPRVRGGGKGRWQGKLAGPSWEKQDGALLQEVVDEATRA